MAGLEFKNPRFGADADDEFVGSFTGAERGSDAWPMISYGVAS